MTALSEYANRIALRVDEISANTCAGPQALAISWPVAATAWCLVKHLVTGRVLLAL